MPLPPPELHKAETRMNLRFLSEIVHSRRDNKYGMKIALWSFGVEFRVQQSIETGAYGLPVVNFCFVLAVQCYRNGRTTWQTS